MKLIQRFIKGSLLLGMTLLAFAGRGQETLTKSGTPIRPAERMAATFPPTFKSNPSYSDSTAGTYIVVTRPDLLEPIQPLLQWKRQQGYRVELICSTTHAPDSIRNQLLHRYESATSARPAQRYVLIVGDVDRIQSFAGKYTPSGLNNRNTDLYYGEYTGDYIPEAYVGRLSVADSAELVTVVDKIIDYEQGRWATEAHRLLFVAGNESRPPAPTTTNGQVNYLSQLAAQCRPDLDTMCFRNPSSDSLIDSLLSSLGQDLALVNYTAHCTSNGWDNPDITFTAIDTACSSTPTLFVNNCCLANAFTGTCFGERLLRRPRGGAVAAIGATNETLWAEDFFWAVGAKRPPTLLPVYDRLLPGAFDSLITRNDSTLYSTMGYTLGAMMYAGCQAVSLAGSPYDAFYWETYCLLGDPALVPFMGMGDSLEWRLPDSLIAGSTQLDIVCTPYTRISATIDTLLLATAVSTADGIAHLSFNRSLAGDSLTLTATRPEAVPLIATLPITAPRHARIAATHYLLDDTLLMVTIKNVGQETARQHQLSLMQDSNDRQVGTSWNEPLPITIARLAPRSDTLVSFVLNDMAIGREPLLAAQLVASDSLGQPYSILRIKLHTTDCRPRIVTFSVQNLEGDPMGTLLPDNLYQLSPALSHPADSITCWLAGQQLPTRDSEPWLFPFEIAEGTEHLHVVMSAHKDHWKHSREGWLIPYNTWERFETGDFENLPWQRSLLAPWQIDSIAAHDGHYCARSATIGDVEKSTLRLDVETLVDDSLTFYFKVSSEEHDWLYFFLDGRRVGYWSGNSGWRRYARFIRAGRHRLEWVYQKDASFSERDDCAYLDDLRLPLALWELPYGTCEQDSCQLTIEPTSHETRFEIYPNPTTGTANIEITSSTEPRYIEVFDMNGRRVDKIFIPSNHHLTQYFGTHLRFGVYILVLHDQTGSHRKKLIVTK